jgi:non-ribosomal peptide synthetase component F
VLFINNPDQLPVTTWMYNPNLFDASTIARFAELYELLLRSVATEPDAPLNRIYDALGEAEHHLQEAAQKAFQETSLRKLKGARRKAAVAPADGEVNQG